MKSKYFISAIILLFCVKGFAQSNPRMENENYMYTVFDDDFNTPSLDRTQWHVSHDGKKECGIWVDGSTTVNQANGSLNLSIISSPGYTITTWDNKTYTADYISGEVGTDSVFHYGSFECRAKYAHQIGSWPAFWLFGVGDGIPCEEGGGEDDEIDISEFWSYTVCNHPGSTPPYREAMKLENNCHRYYNPGYCDGNSHFHHWYNASMGSSMDDNFHVYKCIWTPDKIAFYMDNVLKNTILYTDIPQYFPRNYPMSLILSQQVTCLDCGNIVAPQTSSFDYVKVKKFFLAPEITLFPNTNTICSSSTATMDVDPAATNITWALTPSGLFSGASTGTGKTANIVRASAANGAGKITYSFKMPSGETFTASKDFWVGKPIINTQVPLAYFNGGTYNNACNSQWYSTNMDIQPSGCTVEWTRIAANPTSTEWYQSGNNVNFYFFALNQTAVYRVTASNSCGSVSYDFGFKSVDCSGGGGGCDVTYVLSPNPASDLVTITPQIPAPCDPVVAPAIAESAFLSVYDQQGTLKQKIKYKSRTEAKIDVSKLKDGIYFVRVVDGNSTKQQTLVVHH